MFRRLLVPVLLMLLSSPAFAKGIQLPTDSRVWFNTSPVSLETLKGKGVVFYFFEEG